MLEYSTDLFERATIQRMLGHFQRFLEGIAADPDQRIGQLPMLTEAERRQLLVEWNDTRPATQSAGDPPGVPDCPQIAASSNSSKSRRSGRPMRWRWS